MASQINANPKAYIYFPQYSISGLYRPMGTFKLSISVSNLR